MSVYVIYRVPYARNVRVQLSRVGFVLREIRTVDFVFAVGNTTKNESLKLMLSLREIIFEQRSKSRKTKYKSH